MASCICRIVMEARDPARNLYRSWRIEAGRDLLGDWTVRITFGRIGTEGRTLLKLVAGEEAARLVVRRALARRALAPKRTGVPYRVVEQVVS